MPIVENDAVKILWDFGLYTPAYLLSNRPEIVLFLKEKKRIIFFGVSCPADINVLTKEQDKLNKYQALVWKFSECYCQPVVLVPIVFSHSGVVSSKQQTYLKQIPGYNEYLFNYLQKTAIVGTINILQSINFGNT